MEYLVGCLESQSFSGSVIQSIFDHSQFLFCDRVHAAFFWDVLAQQAVEVFVAAALPTAIWVSEVGLNAQRLIHLLVVRKFFAVVYRQGLHACAQRLESVLNRLADQVGAFVEDFAQPGIPAFALDQGHDGLLVSRPNDRIALPVAHLLARLNVRRPLANRAPVGNLSSPIMPRQTPPASGLLTAQVLV